ncbi:uncharacterized protein [Antedon mediterranea]|uniref:uncharacterized protein isoform X2 n=1 Tax=Antedon mediterranea TaxID=105859 RepID=UPI003AF69829
MCRRPYCHFRHVRTSKESPVVTSENSNPVESVGGNGCSYVATPLAKCPKDEASGSKDTSSGVLHYKATPIPKEKSTTAEFSYKATPMYGHFGSNDLAFSETEPDEITDKTNSNKYLENSDDLHGSKRYSFDSVLPTDDDFVYDPVQELQTNEDASEDTANSPSSTQLVYHATKLTYNDLSTASSSEDHEQKYHPAKNYSTKESKENPIDQKINSQKTKNKRLIEVDDDNVSNKKIKKDEASLIVIEDVNNKEMKEEKIKPNNDYYSSDTTGDLQIIESDDHDKEDSEKEETDHVQEHVVIKPKISEEKLAEFFSRIQTIKKPVKTYSKKCKVNKSFGEMIMKKKKSVQKFKENSNLTKKANKIETDNSSTEIDNKDGFLLKRESDKSNLLKIEKGSSKEKSKQLLRKSVELKRLKIEKSKRSISKSKSPFLHEENKRKNCSTMHSGKNIEEIDSTEDLEIKKEKSENQAPKKEIYIISSSSSEEIKKTKKRKISIELFGEDSEEEGGNIFKKMKIVSSSKKQQCTKNLREASRTLSEEEKPSNKVFKKHKTSKIVKKKSFTTSDDYDSVSYNDISSDLTDFETDTYEECLKIFNEETKVKIEEVPDVKMNIEEEYVDTNHPGRKRQAHVSKHGEVRRPVQRRIPAQSPAQICHNRYLKIQEMLARRINVPAEEKSSLDKRRLAHLPKVVPKTSTPKGNKSITATPSRTSQKSAERSTTPSQTNSFNSIAATPSSASRKSIDRSTTPSNTSRTSVDRSVVSSKKVLQSPKPTPRESVDWVTIAGTADKGVKRVAHVPKTKASKRPVIPLGYGKNIPNVVRQRYLTMFIDELIKVGLEEQTAFDTALGEEKLACEKASSKNVYLNVCINTVKRIRSMDNRNTKKTSTPVKSVSHLANIGGKRAAQTSFSIQEKIGMDFSKLRGLNLYNMLQKYLMTEQELNDNGYPRPDSNTSGKAIVYVQVKKKVKSSDPNHNICTRCSKAFLRRPDGRYITKEECVYHWGKLWKRKVAGSFESRYTCCSGDAEATGCCVGKYHVTDEKCENFDGFMKTIAKSPLPNKSPGVFALDCEMCYTNKGLELTRVTVIGESMEKVYDSLVKPPNPIVDHNTRFSGITENDMKSVTTSIRDVQAVLLSLFSADTILLGHSLESDLLALKLIHSTVIDTAIVFPHRRGPPFKKALRTLMADCLNTIIQNNVDGHDSTEDAKSCLQLMFWKIKEDSKIKAHS